MHPVQKAKLALNSNRTQSPRKGAFARVLKEANLLTVERLRELLSYDAETGVFRWKFACSRRVRVGDVAGVIAHDRARLIRADKKLYRAHRLAWFYVYAAWPQEVDHINGDPSDNRLSNLRECTRCENTRNVRVHKDNASGLKGAYRDKKRWASRIYVSGKNINLGTFDTAAEAAAAYDAAALKYHGAFARLNRG